MKNSFRNFFVFKIIHLLIIIIGNILVYDRFLKLWLKYCRGIQMIQNIIIMIIGFILLVKGADFVVKGAVRT